MKKLLLTLVLGLATISANAQSCTPGANFADSTYGAWPDTVTNFPGAVQNVFYTTDLNFKVPDNVTIELDPTGQFVGSPIQDFTVTDVTGLPTGYDYACNIAGCVYAGGSNGCANLYGTTSQTGTFPVEILIDATIIIDILGFPTPVSQSTSFTGYKVVVGAAGLIEEVIAPLSVYPNPTNGEITVKGVSASMDVERIEITDLNGKVVASSNGVETTTFDLSNNISGLYFVKVYHAAGIDVTKFVKQ